MLPQEYKYIFSFYVEIETAIKVFVTLIDLLRAIYNGTYPVNFLPILIASDNALAANTTVDYNTHRLLNCTLKMPLRAIL